MTKEGDALVAERRIGAARGSSADVAGFSVFAGQALSEREQIEKLCRYIARPPVANEQLTETNDGRIAVKLKRPRRDGQTHAFLSPLGLLRRLTRLIPPAGMHLLRYAGILAPAAKFRSKVVPVPNIQLDISPNAVTPVVAPRRIFACREFSPPPPSAMFPQFRRDPAKEGTCMQCHSLIDPAAIHFKRFDPLGLAYGGIGRWSLRVSS